MTKHLSLLVFLKILQSLPILSVIKSQLLSLVYKPVNALALLSCLSCFCLPHRLWMYAWICSSPPSTSSRKLLLVSYDLTLTSSESSPWNPDTCVYVSTLQLLICRKLSVNACWAGLLRAWLCYSFLCLCGLALSPKRWNWWIHEINTTGYMKYYAEEEGPFFICKEGL